MVRSCEVISQRLRREASEEHRAAVVDPLGELFGISHAELKVFGGDLFGEAHCGIERVANDDRAVVFERLRELLFTLCRVGPSVDCLEHLLCQLLRIRQDDRGSHLVVFCLREHVGCDILGVCRLVCDDEDLRRACEHVDVDLAVYEPLCRVDVDVARAADLIYPGHCLGAVCHCCDRLCSAHLVDLGSARDGCRCEDDRCYRSVLSRRRRENDPSHACN